MRLFGSPDFVALKQKGDFKGLRKALRHRNPEVRKEAASALGDLCGPRGVAAMAAMYEMDLSKKSNTWAISSALADEAVESLTSALQDDDVEVREAAAAALENIGGPAAERTANR